MKPRPSKRKRWDDAEDAALNAGLNDSAAPPPKPKRKKKSTRRVAKK